MHTSPVQRGQGKAVDCLHNFTSDSRDLSLEVTKYKIRSGTFLWLTIRKKTNPIAISLICEAVVFLLRARFLVPPQHSSTLPDENLNSDMQPGQPQFYMWILWNQCSYVLPFRQEFSSTVPPGHSTKRHKESKITFLEWAELQCIDNINLKITVNI